MHAINKKLVDLKQQVSFARKWQNDFTKEAPLTRAKREIYNKIENSIERRSKILQSISVFAGLSTEGLASAVRSLEEVDFIQDEVIIQEGDIGDAFYILESGLAAVTRAQLTNGGSGPEAHKPRILAVLQPQSYFGELALLSDEPRKATITVCSETAKCLRMTKPMFVKIVEDLKALKKMTSQMISRRVIDNVSVFRGIPFEKKAALASALVEVSFNPGEYVCRQGTPGNNFFIITDGECKVTFTGEHDERFIANLYAGDYFGELALLDATTVRTANVIASGPLVCSSLHRHNFNALQLDTKSLFNSVSETRKYVLSSAMNANAASASSNSTGTQADRASRLALKFKHVRRISSMNVYGQKSTTHALSLFRRFGRFTTECAWNCLYGKFYRALLLHPEKRNECGAIAHTLMDDGSIKRADAVSAIREHVRSILTLGEFRRNIDGNAFVAGLLSQHNDLRDRLCCSWPTSQFEDLCHEMGFLEVPQLHTVAERETL